MKTLLLAVAVVVAVSAAVKAQIGAPNAAGVAMSHLHYRVADVQAERAFWLALGGKAQPADEDGEVVAFPGLLVVVSRTASPASPEGSVVAHVAFRVKTFAQVEAAGIKVERRRIEGRESGMAVAPSGERVELFEENAEQVRFKPEPGQSTDSAERHNRPMTAAVEPHHIHLNMAAGQDVLAQRFYVEHLGGVPGIRLRYPAADFPGINFNFSAVTTATAPTSGRTLDHVAFVVASLPAVVQKLGAAGVRVEQRAGERRAQFVDPWGTSIELIERR